MKIVNIVISGKLSSSINLGRLHNCVYQPKKFSGAVYDCSGCTFLLFRTGSFVCLGAVTLTKAHRAIEQLAFDLNVKVTGHAVKNMVISDKLDRGIDLPQLYNKLKHCRKNVIYEDEIFNGIVWKEHGGTVRLFHTGSYFVTGLDSAAKLKKVCHHVRNICSVETYK